MELKFEVEIVSENRRRFHTTVELVSVPITHFQRNVGIHAERMKKFSKIITNTVSDLFNIENVTNIYIQPYLVMVDIDLGSSGKWDKKIDELVECMCLTIHENAISQPKKNVSIKLGSSDHERIFQTNWNISQTTYRRFERPLIAQDRLRAINLIDIGRLGARLIEQLLNVDGVTKTLIYYNEIKITIANLFDWAEVELRVRQILVAVFGNDIEFTHE